MNIFKFFKKSKENSDKEGGIKVFLDFELKNFKYLTADAFQTSEELTKYLIEDQMKSGTPLIFENKEIYNVEDIILKKLSALFLIIKMQQSNVILSQRKLNFYERPYIILKTPEKNLDYFLVFSLSEPQISSNSNIFRRNSKKNSTFNAKKPMASPKKKKKIEFINNFEEDYLRSGNVKKKNKKGEFVEKIFVLFKDRLIYYEPKDKGFI